jgi:hypothetical protein
MSTQPDFNEDPGWQPLDHNQVYSPEEWQAYEQQRLAEMEKLRREGKVSTSFEWEACSSVNSIYLFIYFFACLQLPPDHGYYPAQPVSTF